MRFRSALVFALLAALCAGCGQRHPYPLGAAAHAYVQETLSIVVSPNEVSSLIAVLQNALGTMPEDSAIRIEPAFPAATTSTVGTDSYIAALDDARRKAAALASRLGTRLGAVTSVEEVLSTGGVALGAHDSSVEEPLAITRSPVQTGASGVITLAVSFATSGATIAVFGVHGAQVARQDLKDANGVEVTINARGADVASAARAQASVESAVRAAARRFGVPDASIEESFTNVSMY